MKFIKKKWNKDLEKLNRGRDEDVDLGRGAAVDLGAEVEDLMEDFKEESEALLINLLHFDAIEMIIDRRNWFWEKEEGLWFGYCFRDEREKKERFRV